MCSNPFTPKPKKHIDREYPPYSYIYINIFVTFLQCIFSKKTSEKNILNIQILLWVVVWFVKCLPIDSIDSLQRLPGMTCYCRLDRCAGSLHYKEIFYIVLVRIILEFQSKIVRNIIKTVIGELSFLHPQIWIPITDPGSTLRSIFHAPVLIDR